MDLAERNLTGKPVNDFGLILGDSLVNN